MRTEHEYEKTQTWASLANDKQIQEKIDSLVNEARSFRARGIDDLADDCDCERMQLINFLFERIMDKTDDNT